MARWSEWAKKNLDVVYEGDGIEQYARCPFKANHKHGDQTPSFGINVEKGLYFCHGCKEKGNFGQLATKLKVKLHYAPPTANEVLKTLKSLQDEPEIEEVTRLPESWLNQFTVSRQAYLYWHKERGLSADTIHGFRLGFDARSNSATIPIRDFHGNVLGVIRRRLHPEARPRYIYPKGFHITEHLWGSWRANGERRIAVCEGSVDALACWDIGIPAVALLGSRLSTHQATILKKMGASEVVVMTDNDGEGRRAASRVTESLRGILTAKAAYNPSWRLLDARTKRLRPAKDPAELKPDQRYWLWADAEASLMA